MVVPSIQGMTCLEGLDLLELAVFFLNFGRLVVEIIDHNFSLSFKYNFFNRKYQSSNWYFT